MQHRTPASIDQGAPSPVNPSEILAILDPLIELRESLPLLSQAAKAFDGLRFGVGIPRMSLFFQVIVLAGQRRLLRRGLLPGVQQLAAQ
jgi:hypothetical protein